MNQSTIDTILTAMQQFLSALQLKKLKSVLVETPTAQAAQAETNETGELLAAFLSAYELEPSTSVYLRPISKMLAVSEPASITAVAGSSKGAACCNGSSTESSTPSPSARKNLITSSTLRCRDSLSSP